MFSGKRMSSTCNMKTTLEKRMTGVHLGRHSALSIQLPLYRSDIFYRQILKDNPLTKPHVFGTSCPELTEVPSVKSSGCAERLSYVCEESGQVMRNMIDLSLLKSPPFLIMALSNFLFFMWNDIPYMYSVDQAIESGGLDKQTASFIISMIGIFNTVGQIVFGYLGDLDVNLINMLAGVLVLAGAAVAVVPLMQVRNCFLRRWGFRLLMLIYLF